MNTKEAIEFLDDVFSRCRLKKCNLQNLNKIIYLLEQSEKYKQMWEELKRKFATFGWAIYISDVRDLEQKYLKGANSNETKDNRK